MREVVVVGFHQCHNRSFLVLSTTTKMVVALETHTIFFPPLHSTPSWLPWDTFLFFLVLLVVLFACIVLCCIDLMIVVVVVVVLIGTSRGSIQGTTGSLRRPVDPPRRRGCPGEARRCRM